VIFFIFAVLHRQTDRQTQVGTRPKPRTLREHRPLPRRIWPRGPIFKKS